MRALLLAALLLPGCATYMHIEKYDPGTGQLVLWKTRTMRTWGTTDIEWRASVQEEKGSIRGDGMSAHLQQTLGDDALATLGDDAKCVLNPALCLGLLTPPEPEPGPPVNLTRP